MNEPSKDGSSRRSITSHNSQGQTNHFIIARLHMFEVQAFDDPNARSQECAVRLRAVRVEAADGEVVDSHGLNAAAGQICGRILSDVNELLLKRATFPEAAGILGLEEYALALAYAQRVERTSRDPLRVADGNASRQANSRRNRHRVDPAPVVQKMTRRVHVSADMHSRAELGHIRGFARGNLHRLQPLKRRISRPANHAVFERDRDIDPFPAHAAQTMHPEYKKSISFCPAGGGVDRAKSSVRLSADLSLVTPSRPANVQPC